MGKHQEKKSCASLETSWGDLYVLQYVAFVFQEPEKKWGKIHHLANLEKTASEMIEFKGKKKKKIPKPLLSDIPTYRWVASTKRVPILTL